MSVEVAFALVEPNVVGVNGNICASEEDEILLLKVVQSVDERYPSAEFVAWVIDSVEPENESGPDTVAVRSEPVPLPTKRPVSVVEPVPPFATPRVPVIVESERQAPPIA